MTSGQNCKIIANNCEIIKARIQYFKRINSERNKVGYHEKNVHWQLPHFKR